MDSKHRNTGFFGKLVQLMAKAHKNLRENGVRVTWEKTTWWIENHIKVLEGLRYRQYMELNRYTE